MTVSGRGSRFRWGDGALLLVLAVLLALTGHALLGAARAAGPHEVRQKNRTFQPASLALARGEVVRVINDDGELIHHAYVDSPGFKFDSGEQAPQSATDIRFTTAGTFSVMCAIHPKMLLTVVVK